jgi:predicted acylesterase/phospholipase RssA
MNSPENDEGNSTTCVQKNKFNAICLSGGGMKGFSILGALQYGYDNKLISHDSINYYSGNSIGAIISYLLAIGYTPLDILKELLIDDVVKECVQINISSMTLGEKYNVSTFDKLASRIEKLTLRKIGKILTFGSMYKLYGKKLYMSVYNYTKRKREYKSYETDPDLPCIIALQMTSAIPGLFPYVEYEGCIYLDGFVGDNFPIEKVDFGDNIIFGVDCDARSEDKTYDPPKSFPEYFFAVVSFLTHKKYKPPKNSTIVEIESKSSTASLDFSITKQKQLEAFKVGYLNARDKFDKVEPIHNP